MELKCEAMGSYCGLQVFEINGLEADYREWGTKMDESNAPAEDYCCGNMTFTPYPLKQELLEKYDLTVLEYTEVCYKLISELSFGKCGWCS